MEQLNWLVGPSDWWQGGLMGLVMLGLAVWRVSSLLVNEEGPWDIFCKLRHVCGVRFNEYSQAYGMNVLGKAMCCVWCLSVWIGAVFSLAYLIAPRMTLLLALPLALSALSIGIEKVVSRE